MRVGQSLRMIASKAAWDLTGSLTAGAALVQGLHSQDENVRTIAGMLIVKAGSRAEPLLLEELRTGEDIPLILTVLADIATPSAEDEIRRFVDDSDPEISGAALEALRVLEANRNRSGGTSLPPLPRQHDPHR